MHDVQRIILIVKNTYVYASLAINLRISLCPCYSLVFASAFLLTKSLIIYGDCFRVGSHRIAALQTLKHITSGRVKSGAAQGPWIVCWWVVEGNISHIHLFLLHLCNEIRLLWFSPRILHTGVCTSRGSHPRFLVYGRL